MSKLSIIAALALTVWLTLAAPLWLLWIAVAAALSTFVVETAFVYAFTARRLIIESDVEIPSDMKAMAYFWYYVGAPADVVFNWTRGTTMFRELPRWGEWMFSARVQRHVLESEGRRFEKALRWAAVLNAIAPRHIKVPQR